GPGQRREGQVDCRDTEFRGQTARDQRLARARRAEQDGGAVAVLQPVTQPAQRGIATGQRDVSRRADRLTERSMPQAVVVFVHAVSTVYLGWRFAPLT